MSDKEGEKNVDLLYEIGTARNVDRVWKQFHLNGVANLAEHTFRVQWLALVIAKLEGITNSEQLSKIALMALQHDVSEIRTGDVAFVSRQYTDRKEDVAIKDIFTGTVLENLILPLWSESAAKLSIEAKIVKDADNLDCDLELRELQAKGNKFLKTFEETRKFVRNEKLYTESAKKLWDDIYRIEPFDWILKAKNRRNDGDWKDKIS